MKYIGYFSDIENNQCKVTFENTMLQDGEVEITLSDTPVTINMSGDTTDIFKPVRYTTAQINILDKRYQPDLISNGIGEVIVRVDRLEDGEVMDILFYGYVEPVTYSQPYANEYDVLTINCVDLLTLLTYKEYTRANIGYKPMSFFEVISSMFTEVGISTFYVSNTGMSAEANGGNAIFEEANFLEWIYCIEENFFDEDGVPWKQSEVLEQICRYLSLTCVQSGHNIYFIDYQTLRGDESYVYSMYSCDTGFMLSSDMTRNYTLTKDNAMSNDANITFDSCYKKAKVVCDLYEIESNILPDFGDTEISENVTEESVRTLDDGRVMPFEYVLVDTLHLEQKDEYKWSWYFSQNRILNGFEYGYIRDFETYNPEFGVYSALYYPKPFMAHIQDELWETQAPNKKYPTQLTDINYWYGANVLTNYAHDARKENPQSTDTDDKYLEELNYNFLPELQTRIGLFSHGIRTTMPDAPVMKIISKPIAMSDGYCICFNLEATVFGDDSIRYLDDKYKITYEEAASKLSVTPGKYYLGVFMDALDSDKMKLDASVTNYIEMYIKYNNRYYTNRGQQNGEEFWSDEPLTYKFFLEVDEDASTLTLKPNMTFFDNVENECFVIPYTSTDVAVSELEISILMPKWMSEYSYKDKDDTLTRDQYTEAIIFDKFEIEVQNTNKAKELKNSDNTEYELTINDTYVNEMSEITLNISTWDNKKPNYSFTMLGDNTDSNRQYYFVDDICFYINDDVHYMRFEEKMLLNYYTQYNKPMIVYNVSIDDHYTHLSPCSVITIPLFGESKRFILDSYGYDVKYKSVNVTLREMDNISDIPICTKQNMQRQYYRNGLIYKENPIINSEKKNSGTN